MSFRHLWQLAAFKYPRSREEPKVRLTRLVPNRNRERNWWQLCPKHWGWMHVLMKARDHSFDAGRVRRHDFFADPVLLSIGLPALEWQEKVNDGKARSHFD